MMWPLPKDATYVVAAVTMTAVALNVILITWTMRRMRSLHRRAVDTAILQHAAIEADHPCTAKALHDRGLARIDDMVALFRWTRRAERVFTITAAVGAAVLLASGISGAVLIGNSS